ncbi:MAG TPA: hypothetical protein VK492_09680 [Chitinophagaceae bacterium]|nr:hypothetical protein [Chitinophagaceae bacterium]
MEVHAHTHTSRKKWTHYFWEFLMLFLAVFCGFLAEYYLEHTIEHNREKQFIESLIKDIDADTAQLSKIKTFRLVRLSSIDSLNNYLAKNTSATISLRGIQLLNNLKGHVAFFENSGTLDQLKNSGGLRLIRKRNVVDSIQLYDQQIKRMALRDLFETDEMRHAVRLSYKMIDGIMLSNIYADTSYFNNNTLRIDASRTIAYSSKDASEYLNSLVTYRFVVVSNMQVQESLRKIAEHLLVLIKKEYHVK